MSYPGGAPVSIVGGSTGGASAGTANNPFAITQANPTSILTGQIALLASTGTNNRAQLPANTLANGIAISASPVNTSDVLVGGSAVSTSETGSGSGFILSPGQSVSFSVANSNAIYLISSAAAVVSYGGN